MAPSPSKDRPRRSRTGCHNCRRLHRKCDETKPSCSGCLASQKQCVYGMRISWGGRPFKKSAFGQCLNQTATVVSIPAESYAGASLSGISPACPIDTDSLDKSFVYGIDVSFRPSEAPRSGALPDLETDRAAPQGPVRTSPTLPPVARGIIQNPSQLSQLSSSHRVLLDHFLHTVTRSFSLHVATHHGFCTTYLPMALDSSTALLPTILEAAALHRRSLGLPQDERELVALRHASIRQFKVPTIGQDDATDDQAVATALMLCLCDILAGGEMTNSWKLHLQGAAAMLRQACEGHQDGSEKQTSITRNFLWRWCESLEVLSLLGPTSNPEGQIVNDEDSDYIDEFHGFSRGLIHVIQEVKLLLMERRSLQELWANLEGQSLQDCLGKLSYVMEERSRLAIRKVKSSLSRNSYTFHPSIQSFISPKIQSDFISIDRAFHHGILLNIYQRVQDLPLNHPNIEESVEAILMNLSQMELRDEACPGVAMLQPLFDAGCGSSRQDHRVRVLELMDSLEKCYGMGNVSRARTFLQEYWLEWDHQRGQGFDLQWDSFIEQKGWELSLY
ncbi:Fc.00g012230.m01.CDS01 [Cosmosporella sp. VM-42]